ncbi:MAG: HypC/HybG/HupF family hydrogenase formation chaperone [Steroidobacteraceae bacterium]|jgi:hydrogenase expression/formation protein HypC|nr:HypC/HybG/HupF family hydrogenase formation chaperone [Steroidobacteraceae bacterium]
MCLAVPCRIVRLEAPDLAVVDVGGVRKPVSLALVDGVGPGDYVIVHVGYALARLDPEAAAATLQAMADAGIDPAAALAGAAA